MASKMKSAFGIYRITAIICFICIALSAHAWPRVSAAVTTTRDDRGVWFITGTDETPGFDLFEAMGYALACDRLWQADLLRRQAHGKIAEIFGKDYLESDIFQRSISYTEAELQEGFDIINNNTRDVISGYVAGFNRRIDEVIADSHLMPFEYTTLAENLGEPVLPHRVTLPVYRSQYGPVISPRPLDPATYAYDGSNPIISWRYAHWGYEFKAIEGFLQLARAQSMEAFGSGIGKIAVSQHFCYADREGNIAYWMSGRNPARYAGEWRLPQGSLPGVEASEWIADEVVPPPKDHNPARGFYGGWNNKAHPDYDNAYNEISDIYGPFHRSHTIYDYIEPRLSRPYRHKFSFEQLRDLALDIAATDSLAIGGNPWPHLAPYFQKAVLAQWWQNGNWRQKIQRLHALWLLKHWDGHFVAGGRKNWAAGPDRADAWMLMDAWVYEVLRLTFGDELGGYLSDGDHGVMTAKKWPERERRVLINVLLHALNRSGDIVNAYDWFKSIGKGVSGRRKIITAALDNALAHLGRRPWGKDQRGWITYEHRLLGKIWQPPFANRSTYAQVVEMGPEGPVRIESMFPLGQSGHIWTSATGAPELDPGFLGMTDIFDTFAPRRFPLFE